MTVLTLEELKDSIKLFSATQCDFLVENCIVALENAKHKTGCVLTVDGDIPSKFGLAWSRSFSRAGYKEEKKITEHSAEALSFFISKELTEFSIIEEATIGTGFDYWLGYDDGHEKYDPANFMQARLEISGIKTESYTNTVRSRIRNKKAQTDVSDGLQLPAYVSVIELSTPKAYFGRK